jgi:hypothetical protein
LATIYVLTQAASNVLLKQVLDDAVAVHVAVLRLLVALPIMAVMALLWGGGAAGIVPLVRGQLGRLIVVAALVGTAFGIWLGSVGTQRLPVGIATSRKPIEMGYSGNPEGKACPSCGSTKVQKTGACHTCLNCGTSLGCS